MSHDWSLNEDNGRERTRVGEHRRASKRPFEYTNRGKHETRPDFNKRCLWRSTRLERILFDYLDEQWSQLEIDQYDNANLEITEPYLRIQDRKSKNVIDEGLRLPRRRGNAKYLRTMEISSFCFSYIRGEDSLHA